MFSLARNLCLTVLFCATLASNGSGSAIAAELIMMEQSGCHWCERWHEEIGPIYPKTTESTIAPLRRLDIHDSLPPDLGFLRMDQFTPTFVLVHEGKEIGRLRGYPGDDFFWPLLSELLAKLPKQPSHSG